MRKGTKGMLGEKLMTLRKKSGYSQQELADRLKVSRQIISNWELNQGAPSIDKAKELVGKMVKLECSDIDLALEEGNDFFSIGKVKVLEVDGEWLRVEYQRRRVFFRKRKWLN